MIPSAPARCSARAPRRRNGARSRDSRRARARRCRGAWLLGFVAGLVAGAVGVRGGRPRLLGERGDRERAAGGVLEHLGRLVGGARVELDEQVDDDLVVVVLVEADVGEELARAVVAERGVAERVAGLRAGARSRPRRSRPSRCRRRPTACPRSSAPSGPRSARRGRRGTEVRLVVHAVQALHDGLLELVDDLGTLAGVGVDPVDALVMDLHLQIGRPAAVAAQPARLGVVPSPSGF